MAYDFPPPPEGRFGQWAYLLWDYVARNRAGAAVAIAAGTAIVIGTSGTGGTFTAAHATSGVAAGTYGAAGILAQFQVSALGHLLSATNAGTLGTFASLNSLVVTGAVTGTSTTGTLTTARTEVLAGDALGTSTTGTLTAALSTTGVTSGTYGGTGTGIQLTVDAKGRISAASNVAGASSNWNVNSRTVGTGTAMTVGTGSSLVIGGDFTVSGTANVQGYLHII